MTKRELFDCILQITSQVCDVNLDLIMSNCRQTDVVDARCIFFYHLRKYGLSSRDIVSLMNKRNLNSINSIIATYDARYKQSFCFRINSKEIGNLLKTKFTQTEQ